MLCWIFHEYEINVTHGLTKYALMNYNWYKKFFVGLHGDKTYNSFVRGNTT
jgi:hypothetical protein